MVKLFPRMTGRFMHSILVAHSNNLDSLKSLQDRARNIVCDNLPFKVVRYSSQIVGNVLVISAEAENQVFKDGGFYSDGQSLTSIFGVPLWPELHEQKRKYSVSDIHGRLHQVGLRSFRREAGGSYAMCTADETGATIVSDFCGRIPWFRSSDGDVTMFCTLAKPLAALRGDAGWALDGAAAVSLAVHGHIWADDTLFRGVTLLETGSAVSIDRFGVRTFPIDDDWYWFGTEPEPNIDDYAEASDRLRRCFEVIGSLVDGRITLGLSGGKDSRVMAAYAAKAGWGDKLLTFTGGLETSPELGVAEEVAGILGVAHERRVLVAATLSNDVTWQRLRANVGRYDAMLLPSAGHHLARPGAPAVEITGYGGEVYRRGIGKQFVTKPIQSVDDARARWASYHVPPDATKVLRPETTAADRARMADWVTTQVDRGFPLEALPELFFVRYRVPFCQGLATGCAAWRQTIEPMINPAVWAVHSRIGRMAGETELTHCALLWHAEPRLCAVPFHRDKWSSGLAHLFPEGSLTLEMPKQYVPDSLVRPSNWNFFKDSKREIVSAFQRRDLSHLAAPERLEEWASSDGELKSSPISNQMYTLLGLQMRASGDFTVVKDG